MKSSSHAGLRREVNTILNQVFTVLATCILHRCIGLRLKVLPMKTYPHRVQQFNIQFIIYKWVSTVLQPTLNIRLQIIAHKNDPVYPVRRPDDTNRTFEVIDKTPNSLACSSYPKIYYW